MPADTKNSTQVVTGEVRLSYAHLFEPTKANDKADPKYSTVILIPKSDTRTLKAIRRAQAAATEAGKAKFGAKKFARPSYTLYDGDEDADLERNPEYADHMYMSVSSVRRPGLVDQNVRPIMSDEDLYSGVYARVAINAFPYDQQGNRGVSFGLNHVQKVRDGEILGGMTRAEDVFDAIDEDEDEDEDLI